MNRTRRIPHCTAVVVRATTYHGVPPRRTGRFKVRAASRRRETTTGSPDRAWPRGTRQYISSRGGRRSFCRKGDGDGSSERVRGRKTLRETVRRRQPQKVFLSFPACATRYEIAFARSLFVIRRLPTGRIIGTRALAAKRFRPDAGGRKGIFIALVFRACAPGTKSRRATRSSTSCEIGNRAQ